ncbi:MAG TPA: hypothetical protein VF276_04430, partial [Chloroflexia bacterium]
MPPTSGTRSSTRADTAPKVATPPAGNGKSRKGGAGAPPAATPARPKRETVQTTAATSSRGTRSRSSSHPPAKKTTRAKPKPSGPRMSLNIPQPLQREII